MKSTKAKIDVGKRSLSVEFERMFKHFSILDDNASINLFVCIELLLPHDNGEASLLEIDDGEVSINSELGWSSRIQFNNRP